MSFQVRFTREAREDLQRLYGFHVEQDRQGARRALESLTKGVDFLRDFPFACRKVLPDKPFLREMLISFGASGYVLLFEIETGDTVTILAVRHQRENDYH